MGDGGKCRLSEHIRRGSDEVYRLAGWWGNDAATRFQMAPTFRPTPGAKGYQHSCTPVFSSIALLATLELIDKVGFSNMVAKGRRLTDTLETLLKASKYYMPSKPPPIDEPFPSAGPSDERVGFKIITPPSPWRGSQISLFITPHKADDGGGKGVMPRVFARMIKKGLVGDEREPSVIRLSPVVLYNTFEQVGKAVKILEEALREEEEVQKGEKGEVEGAERDIIAM